MYMNKNTRILRSSLKSDNNKNIIIEPEIHNLKCIYSCIKRFSINVVEKNIKKQKINEKTFKILNINEYDYLLDNNFNVKQLKEMCKCYKIKQSGSKSEVKHRLYNYLRLTYNAIKIQNVWKNFLIKKLVNLRGPGYLNITKCVNDTDFLTLEPLKEIPYNEFISYKYNNIIYGFNINSIYQLFLNNDGKKILNPYTRDEIPKIIKNNINKLIVYSNFFNKKIINLNNKEVIELSVEKKLELKTISVFQKIDILGNITNHTWFWNLGRILQIKFIRSLLDIWNYRADLSYSTKREICPPYGDPFRGIISLQNRFATLSLNELREISLNIIDILITTGINESSKYLGSTYILCALTLVSDEAANTFPWLYDSVAPI